MNLKSNNQIKVEGGMASMTDLVFLLLIFFIIMSLMSNNTLVVDVPKDSEDITETPDFQDVTVVITEENGYMLKAEGASDAVRGDFKDITAELDAVMANTPKKVLRIEGHRLADYEAVFKVMAYADVQQWKPALAYKK